MENIRRRSFIYKFRDPISALTHLIGFLASIPVLISLVILSYKHATIYHVVSFAIFGASLLMLYGASTIYHALPVSDKAIAVLRRIDHMMIFILIAGTYTPICVVTLNGKWGWILLALVWGFALFGIILKAVWFNAPRWISTAIYVIMGWLVVFAFYPLSKAVSFGGIMLLLLGGIAYTVGALIYALKKPKLPFENFGFHEVFHVFVMIGTTFHIMFMYIYVL